MFNCVSLDTNKCKNQIQTLIKEKYYDVNLSHLGELLNLNEGIQVKLEALRNGYTIRLM